MGDPLRQGFHHVDRHGGGGWIIEAEANATHARLMQLPQLAIGDRRVQDRDAPRVGTELGDRIDRDLILRPVIPGRDDDDSSGSDSLLQQAVLRHSRIGGRHTRTRHHGEARRVVDVHVAVARVERRNRLRRRRACGVGYDHCVSVARICAEAGTNDRETGSLQEGTPFDAVVVAHGQLLFTAMARGRGVGKGSLPQWPSRRAALDPDSNANRGESPDQQGLVTGRTNRWLSRTAGPDPGG